MRVGAVVVCAFLATAPGTAAAQATASAGAGSDARCADLVGERLRVTEPGASTSVQGRLVEARGDTLWLLGLAGEPVAVATTRATVVQRFHRHDPTTRYTIVGALLGGAVGGLAGYALAGPDDADDVDCAERDEDPVTCFFGGIVVTTVEESFDQAAAALLGVAIGATLGTVAGRALGRSRVHEGWVPVEGVRVTAAPAPGGGLRLGVRWTP